MVPSDHAGLSRSDGIIRNGRGKDNIWQSMKAQSAGGVVTARFAGALIQTANQAARPCNAVCVIVYRFEAPDPYRGSVKGAATAMAEAVDGRLAGPGAGDDK